MMSNENHTHASTSHMHINNKKPHITFYQMHYDDSKT